MGIAELILLFTAAYAAAGAAVGLAFFVWGVGVVDFLHMV